MHIWLSIQIIINAGKKNSILSLSPRGVVAFKSSIKNYMKYDFKWGKVE